MEMWDLYDKDRKPLNKLHKRGEPIPAGAYHIAVSVLTCSSEGKVLLTLRNLSKQPYPGLWEITAGSVISGEDSLTAAKRELFEETGIEPLENEPRLIYTYTSSHGSGSIVDMYIIKRDIPAGDIKLQKGETEAAKWVTPEQFDEMSKKGLITPPVVRRFNIYRRFLNG